MNLRDLDYLIAVADHQHFGKAAEACNISQPTLSMQLKKLEETLGVTLFERGHKHVLVTPVGEMILQGARHIQREAREIRDIARRSQNPLAGHIKLGVFPTLAPYILPLCIPDIHAELPLLTLFLVEEKTDALLKQLKDGALDAALLALPIVDPALESVPLFDEDFMLAVPPTHPLSKRKWVTIDDLKDESLLLLEEGHCLRAQALEICSLIGTSERQEFRATSLETLRHMVQAGVGSTLIPRLAMKNDDGISYIPFKNSNLKRTIGLVRRKMSAPNAALERIKVIIQQLTLNM